MDAHILLSPVGQKTETRFNCLLTENRKSTEMMGTPSTVRKLLPPLRRGTRSARPRGLGGDFEFLPLKSPRNPITPFETSRVATLHPGLYKRLREGARRVIGATAKPLYPIDGKAAGFDRRNPKTSLFEGGGPPAAVEGVRGGGRSPQTMIPPRSPTPHSSCEFGFFFICFMCPKHMMFVSKTIRFPSVECRDHRPGFTANQPAIPAR